ncbi:MAG TPA: hypothetical protein PKC03_06185, partial [Dokdonella sp.]|nr:hypothetical protein [Dokdonella sp.]
ATITVVASCDYVLVASPLTTDEAWRKAAKAVRLIDGRIDRETFMRPGTYLFRDALLDADGRVVRHIDVAAFSTGFSAPDRIPPLGASPDGRSIVRVGEAWTPSGTAVLQDFDVDTNSSRLLVIDRAATRFAGSDAVDGKWLEHYYQWVRADDGHDRLVVRAEVDPLPYRGVLHTESSGSIVYQLKPAGAGVRDLLVEFLHSDFGAQRTIRSDSGNHYTTTIDGLEVNVFADTSYHQVVLFLAGESDGTLVRRIAEAFDAVLATGRYDDLFEQTTESALQSQ